MSGEPAWPAIRKFGLSIRPVPRRAFRHAEGSDLQCRALAPRIDKLQFWFGERESQLSGYVTNAPSELPFCLYVFGLNGGRDRTRTCDLLRVKQAL